MKNLTLISRVLDLGLGTQVLGLGLGLGLEAQVLVNITVCRAQPVASTYGLCLIRSRQFVQFV